MQISIIAAIGSNNELGANNQLLWHLPIDFKWFIARTKGKPVIMGRKTMESLGKPLKNRLNIVLSRQFIEVAEGFVLVNSWDQAFDIAKQSESEEIMIIGGAQIYEQALEFAEIKGRFEKVANAPSDKTKENERFTRIESTEFNANQKRMLDSLKK